MITCTTTWHIKMYKEFIRLITPLHHDYEMNDNIEQVYFSIQRRCNVNSIS